MDLRRWKNFLWDLTAVCCFGKVLVREVEDKLFSGLGHVNIRGQQEKIVRKNHDEVNGYFSVLRVSYSFFFKVNGEADSHNLTLFNSFKPIPLVATKLPGPLMMADFRAFTTITPGVEFQLFIK